MSITVIGSDWCPDCRRTNALLNRLGVPFTYDNEGDTKAKARAVCGKNRIPCVCLPDGSFITEPSDRELEAKLRALKLVK
ncbi:hypothetical protein KIPB_000308 [Kipferlia bialata]|uniref:Glutaredoxin domain-containing protein n=1 Tax=Kipferlia bialata TaxID=797122 RepID=A0A9K3CLW1_9EUKA|nr:hypothetical protein KIPB_000308 [Kipferlia bialata]|eukprot:g308.t1